MRGTEYPKLLVYIYLYKPPLGLTGYFAMFQYIKKCSMFYSSKNQIINKMGPDDITTCELVYIKWFFMACLS